MTDIIDGYLEEVSRSLRARPSEREQIERELRSHLEEKLAALRREHPGTDDEELQRQVVEAFGSPRDLALAYTEEGAEIRNETGETLLRIGQAVGRGTGTVLKWVGVGSLVLILIVASLGIWAFYEVRPVILEAVAGYVEADAYQYNEHCGPDPCDLDPPAQAFFVQPGTREVQLDVGFQHTSGAELGGQAMVRVTDGTGAVVYDRMFQLDERRHVHEETTLAPVQGNWTVDIELVGFTGSFDVHVVKVGTDAERISGW